MAALTSADVTAIVPTLDEAGAIGGVVSGLLTRGMGRVIVADGGSSDGTATIARNAGAMVVTQRERGYGAACLAGVEAAGAAPVLLFLDGDGAEDLDGAAAVVQCLLDGRAGLVLGARLNSEAGAQTDLALLGNRLCSWWLRAVFGAPVHDFASMKAIRRDVYAGLHPEHRTYGWTAQLLTRAARRHVAIAEVPVVCHQRAGTSKVSGTFRGALGAGRQMLAVLAAETAGAALESLPGRPKHMRRLDTVMNPCAAPPAQAGQEQRNR